MNTTTAFKPRMESYGSRKFVPLYFFVILVCVITPCTNWIIPFAKKLKVFRGKIIIYGEKND